MRSIDAIGLSPALSEAIHLLGFVRKVNAREIINVMELMGHVHRLDD